MRVASTACGENTFTMFARPRGRITRAVRSAPYMASQLGVSVDLWGRLSNPAEAQESAAEQGFHGIAATGRKVRKAAGLPSNRPGADGPNNRGRLSNPATMIDDRAHSPTADRSARHPGRRVQRRLTPPELEAVVARYQSGCSLNDLAREFGIYHRSVADYLERLCIARRVNLPKLSAADVKWAATRYRNGESLATVGKALKVDASTVQRALKRAGVPIWPRPGC